MNYTPYNEESTNKIYELLFSNRGIVHPDKELFAVVLEVGLEDGLDTLAAYKDGTARYINQSGKMIIWETRTRESDELIENLFQQAQTVVDKIGPWDDDRKPPPGNGMIRMSFLVGNNLYFGEGPFQALYNDPMGRPVIDGGTKLMQFLIDNSLSSRA